MAMSAKDVIKKFNVKLLKKLPLDDKIFFAKANEENLFPEGSYNSIEAERTRAEKVSHFLQHVVEPGADVYLPKLLKVMKKSDDDSVKKLADEIQAVIEPGMHICIFAKVVHMYMHNLLSVLAGVDQVLFSQSTTYLYPSFQGYIRFVSLLFPLICPCKVVHIILYVTLSHLRSKGNAIA